MKLKDIFTGTASWRYKCEPSEFNPRITHYYYVCTHCQYDIPGERSALRINIHKAYPFDYCPNCGRKMDNKIEGANIVKVSMSKEQFDYWTSRVNNGKNVNSSFVDDLKGTEE